MALSRSSTANSGADRTGSVFGGQPVRGCQPIRKRAAPRDRAGPQPHADQPPRRAALHHHGEATGAWTAGLRNPGSPSRRPPAAATEPSRSRWRPILTSPARLCPCGQAWYRSQPVRRRRQHRERAGSQPVEISAPRAAAVYIAVTAAGHDRHRLRSLITIAPPAFGSGMERCSSRWGLIRTSPAVGGLGGRPVYHHRPGGGGGSTGNAQALSPRRSRRQGRRRYTSPSQQRRVDRHTSGPWITIAPPASGSGNGTLSIQWGLIRTSPAAGASGRAACIRPRPGAARQAPSRARFHPCLRPRCGRRLHHCRGGDGAWTASTTDPGSRLVRRLRQWQRFRGHPGGGQFRIRPQRHGDHWQPLFSRRAAGATALRRPVRPPP